MEFTLFGTTFSILALMGILAFIVNIIVEMIKDLDCIKKIPTKMIALLVSIAVVEGAMLIYLSYTGMSFVWWYFAGAFFAAFIVGYLSIFGWDVLNDSWKRYVPGEKESGGK